MSRKVTVHVAVEKETFDALCRLRKRTRVPVTEYLREGADLILEKYGEKKEPRKNDTISSPLVRKRMEQSEDSGVTVY